MSARMRRPATEKLHISQGDWLDVKKYLTTGEFREWMRFAEKANGDGIDKWNYGLGKVAVYLTDWSIGDADGNRIEIAEDIQLNAFPVFRISNKLVTALNALPIEDWTEILKAVEAHEDAIAKEREAEKNAQATGSASSPTLPSAA